MSALRERGSFLATLLASTPTLSGRQPRCNSPGAPGPPTSVHLAGHRREGWRDLRNHLINPVFDGRRKQGTQKEEVSNLFEVTPEGTQLGRGRGPLPLGPWRPAAKAQEM